MAKAVVIPLFEILSSNWLIRAFEILVPSSG